MGLYIKPALAIGWCSLLRKLVGGSGGGTALDGWQVRKSEIFVSAQDVFSCTSAIRSLVVPNCPGDAFVRLSPYLFLTELIGKRI